MYISFLRGINVSGKNKIEMNALKILYEALGFKEVNTYLNTGNVIFSSSLPKGDIGIKIEEAIQSKFDLDIEVIVRSKEELKRLIESYPFGHEGKNRYVTLLKTSSDVIDKEKILEASKPLDKTYFTSNEIMLFVPEGYGKSKLTNRFFEKMTLSIATTRNMNTLEKIYKKM
ncbi:MAG: DUF1697 domain-containing protein [Clostridiales bacterium]|nr:DUF1697 domain-containing protein [Clostridiales bacterium]